MPLIRSFPPDFTLKVAGFILTVVNLHLVLISMMMNKAIFFWLILDFGYKRPDDRESGHQWTRSQIHSRRKTRVQRVTDGNLSAHRPEQVWLPSASYD